MIDVASGAAWRKLDGHKSVMAATGLTQQVEGRAMKVCPPGKPEVPVVVHSDGIELSPDGKTLYYTPLVGRDVYAVPTDYLVDRSTGVGADEVVKQVATKPSGNDGLAIDREGRLYTSDFEDGTIRRITPAPGGGAAKVEVVTRDERLLWPDTFAWRGGELYVTANQLNRQPKFNVGRDEQQDPFVIFRVPTEPR